MVLCNNSYFLSANTILYRKQTCVNISPYFTVTLISGSHGEGLYRNYFFHSCFVSKLACLHCSRQVPRLGSVFLEGSVLYKFNQSCIIICTVFVINCFLVKSQNVFWELQAEFYHCCQSRQCKLCKLCNILHFIFYDFFII